VAAQAVGVGARVDCRRLAAAAAAAKQHFFFAAIGAFEGKTRFEIAAIGL